MKQMSKDELSGYLQRVTDVAPAMIYVYNQALHRNEYANRSIGETLGFSAQDIQDMGAELMAKVLHPDDAAHVFQHFADIQNLNDDESISVEYRMQRKDGRIVWLLSTDTVFRRDDTGKVTHHIGTAIDITAQKSAELIAIEAQEQAQAINSELRDFSYSVSHDLKSPANTMQLILSELSECNDTASLEERQDLITHAQATVSGMKGLIDDVLSYTDVIGQQIEFERTDLTLLVDSVLAGVRADVERTSAIVKVGDLPEVMAVPTQVSIALQNLILNAIKFTKDDAPADISIQAEPAGEGKVKISIKDQGIGISETKKQEIFQLFKKLNSQADYGGNGLGLAICRRIARNHGSDIHVTSTLGQGSTFSLELEIA